MGGLAGSQRARVQRGESATARLITLPVSLRRSGRGCSLLRASDEHILIVRVLRARRTICLLPGVILRPRVARAQRIIRVHPFLYSALSLPAALAYPHEGWAGRSSNARVERARFYNVPSKLACFAFLEGRPCWSTCGRRTRPF